MKHLILSLFVASTLSGCLSERQRPRDVAPTYVARCPDGYRYDGHDCHRVVEERPAVIEVRVR
jgi:hypothetical protein